MQQQLKTLGSELVTLRTRLRVPQQQQPMNKLNNNNNNTNGNDGNHINGNIISTTTQTHHRITSGNHHRLGRIH